MSRTHRRNHYGQHSDGSCDECDDLRFEYSKPEYHPEYEAEERSRAEEREREYEAEADSAEWGE